MKKIESRDFALIFLGKRPFNTLLKMELSDIVIVTMGFISIWHKKCSFEILGVICIYGRLIKLDFVPDADAHNNFKALLRKIIVL